MYADYDPKVKIPYKGIVYITLAKNDVPHDLRHQEARNTGYDSRNDPAFHYGSAPRFELMYLGKMR